MNKGRKKAAASSVAVGRLPRKSRGDSSGFSAAAGRRSSCEADLRRPLSSVCPSRALLQGRSLSAVFGAASFGRRCGGPLFRRRRALVKSPGSGSSSTGTGALIPSARGSSGLSGNAISALIRSARDFRTCSRRQGMLSAPAGAEPAGAVLKGKEAQSSTQTRCARPSRS